MKKVITIALFICFSASGFAQTPNDSIRKDEAEAVTGEYIGSSYMYISLGSLFFATMALNARDSLARRGEIERARGHQTFAIGSMIVCLGNNLIYAAKTYWPFGFNQAN